MRAIIPLMLGLVCLLQPQPGQAQFIDWQFKSEYPHVVEFSLYSQHRHDYSWPGPGRVYVLRDASVHSVRTACLVGETLCYGAWVKNREDIYWGTGYNNAQRCSHCCYSCDGRDTGVIRLTP